MRGTHPSLQAHRVLCSSPCCFQINPPLSFARHPSVHCWHRDAAAGGTRLVVAILWGNLCLMHTTQDLCTLLDICVHEVYYHILPYTHIYMLLRLFFFLLYTCLRVVLKLNLQCQDKLIQYNLHLISRKNKSPIVLCLSSIQ